MNSTHKINPSLQDALKKWLQPTLKFLKDNYAKSAEEFAFWFYDESSAKPVKLAMVPQDDFIVRAATSDSKLYWETCTALSKDALIKTHTDGEIFFLFLYETVSEDDILKWFLKIYLKNSQGKPDFVDDVFAQSIAVFRDFFESSQLTLRCWANVLNCKVVDSFSCDLQCTTGTSTVRKIDLKEAVSLFLSVNNLREHYHRRDVFVPSDNMIIWNLIVDFSLKGEKKFVEPNENERVGWKLYYEICDHMRRIENCLRLASQKWLGLSPLFIWVENAPLGRFSELKVSPPWINEYIPQGNLLNIVNDEFAEPLLKRWEKIERALAMKSSFEVAFNRFGFSYDRYLPQDNLIDQMIAFEALFLRDIKPSKDIGGKLANRVCNLLAESRNDRKVLGRRVKRGYELRKQIVHGEEYSPKELRDEIPRINDVLKKSFIKILDNNLIEEIGKREFWNKISSSSRSVRATTTDWGAQVF